MQMLTVSSRSTTTYGVSVAQHLLDAPVSAEQIRDQTEKDPTLAPVLQFLKQDTMKKESRHFARKDQSI